MTPSSPEPTYLVRVAQLLLNDAQRAGIDRDALLRELGLDAKLLENPDDRLPLHTLTAIVRAVIARSREGRSREASWVADGCEGFLGSRERRGTSRSFACEPPVHRR